MTEFIDLSGVWELSLDQAEAIKNIQYNENIKLPDTISNARKCRENKARETGFLTDTYKFEGTAWFGRTIDTNISGCHALKLFLERTRITEVYIDGASLGIQESFIAPHIYDLSEFIGTGEHRIDIKVKNVGYKTGGGHMTSQDTQTNWNGITGRIGLVAYGEAYCENVFIRTDIHKKTVEVTADIIGKEKGEVVISVYRYPSGEIAGKSAALPYSENKLNAVYHMEDDCKLWSEHTPELYEISIKTGNDEYRHIFGMREFLACGDKFTINGRKTFLRGKHDGMIFPKTSYAPCDVDEWLRVMRIAKSFGINHYRFHTCCPPEAAFTAADILGIYMEPQLPFWGTIHAPDEEGFNKEEQEFLISEGYAMLREFGSHPSFCMMSMGNELWGSRDRINEIMGMFKAFDNRHLYTQGSNNFQWVPNIVENDDFFVGVRLSNDRLIRGSYAMCDAPLGHVQTEKPATMHSYDSAISPVTVTYNSSLSEDGTVQIQFGTTMKTVKADKNTFGLQPEIPIISHEIGQYETYPDFDEISKYTGPLKARNFEIFRERLEAKGLGHLAKDYHYCSGQLAKACYKEELEAAFRSEKLAGFQLLDIQDFSGQGTALVGMLDAFMDNKGIVTAEEWRESCNDAVILALFETYTPLSGSKFSFGLNFVNFRPESMEGRTVTYSFICDETRTEGSCVIPSSDIYCRLGDFELDIPNVGTVTKAVLSIGVEGTDIRNHYDLEIIPDITEDMISDIKIFRELDEEAHRLLEQGENILLFPGPDKLANSVEGFYCQDFWCYPMFAGISRMMNKPEPVGTMGLLIEKEHEALKGFCTERYSTPAWWDIVMGSRCEILDGKSDGKRVIVRMIDNFDRNHDLALLYEYDVGKGKVIVCTSDFEKLKGSSEGRVYLKGIAEYSRKKTR